MLKLRSSGEAFGSVLAVVEAGPFLLRKARFRPGTPLPAHRHPGPYFSYMVEGEFHERVGGGLHRRTAGTIHFHPSEDPHSGRVGERGLVALSVIPHRRLALRLDARPPRDEPAPKLDAIAARCLSAFEAADSAARLDLEALCLQLARVALHETAGRGRAPGRWLDMVRDYLHAHPGGPVGLGELAGIAGVHETHLARAFRRRFGSSPGGYLRRVRIERARAALAGSGTPLAQIALDAGFCSQSHFTRVFRTLVGTTPSSYRRAHRSPQAGGAAPPR